MAKILITVLLFIFLFSNDTEKNNTAKSSSGFLTSMPPGVPVLNSPTDNAENQPDTIVFKWKSQLHTSSFTLEVSLENDFTSITHNENLSDISLQLTGFENKTKYYWRVLASNAAGNSTYSETRSFTTIPPTYAAEIENNSGENLFVYSNPSNNDFTIEYQLSERAKMLLAIYNNQGQIIRVLDSGTKQAGKYQTKWGGFDKSGSRVANGMYIFRLTFDQKVISEKLILNR